MMGASGKKREGFPIPRKRKKRSRQTQKKLIEQLVEYPLGGLPCAGRNWKPYTGVCGACGGGLTGKKKWFCSPSCDSVWKDNHWWKFARLAAKARDGGRCVLCGGTEKLEVDHIAPRWGKGYRQACGHHLVNLRTLCHNCHVIITGGARIERKWKQAIKVAK